MMDIATDGDQVAAHYAAGYAGLFTVIKNGAPHRAGVLSGMARAEAAAGTPTGRWPVTVAVTDTSGATATAGLPLSVAETAAETAAAGATGNLQHAEWAWHHQGDGGW